MSLCQNESVCSTCFYLVCYIEFFDNLSTGIAAHAQIVAKVHALVNGRYSAESPMVFQADSGLIYGHAPMDTIVYVNEKDL